MKFSVPFLVIAPKVVYRSAVASHHIATYRKKYTAGDTTETYRKRQL